MISDTITVITYHMWNIGRYAVTTAKQSKHILQAWLRFALALGESSLARAKVAQSGLRAIARAHFLA